MQKPRSLSWKIKLPIILVAFSLLPVAVVVIATLESFATTFEQNTLRSLSALASAKAEAVDGFTVTRRAEAEKLAQLVAPALADALRAQKKIATKHPEPPLQALEDETPPPENGEVRTSSTVEIAAQPPTSAEAEATLGALRKTIGLILWDQSQFEEILIIGVDGRVIASTFSGHENRSASDLDYFKSGLGASYIAPVFMSPITERLTMVISTPIRNGNAEVIGVLAARLNLVRFFRLINDSTGLGETGETVVAKVIDNEAVLMAPTRSDPDAALSRKVTADGNRRIPVLEAAHGLRGQGKGFDFRGVCVFAAWENVPALEWGLSVEQACSEATAPLVASAMSSTLIALLVAILALIFAVLVAKRLVAPLHKLRVATDQISRGDFEVGLDIRPGDEIGDLAESFERMIVAIRFFRAQSRGEPEPDAEAESDSGQS